MSSGDRSTHAIAMAAMAALTPEIPVLRDWMQHMEAISIATQEQRSLLFSGWQQAQGTITQLMDVLELYHGGVVPLRTAYEHAVSRLYGIETRISQIQEHLSYASLRAAGIGTSDQEQKRVKGGYGEAKYTLDLLIELLITYHVAAAAVYGDGSDTTLAVLLLPKEEGGQLL